MVGGSFEGWGTGMGVSVLFNAGVCRMVGIREWVRPILGSQESATFKLKHQHRLNIKVQISGCGRFAMISGGTCASTALREYIPAAVVSLRPWLPERNPMQESQFLLRQTNNRQSPMTRGKDIEQSNGIFAEIHSKCSQEVVSYWLSCNVDKWCNCAQHCER